MNPWNSIPNIGEGRARTAMPEHGAPYGTPGSKVNIAPLLRPAPEVVPEVTSQEDEAFQALPAMTADEMRGAEGMSDQMNWAFDQATHDMHVRVAEGMADLADQMDGVFKPKGDDAHRDVPFACHPYYGWRNPLDAIVTRRNFNPECEWLYNPWTGTKRNAVDVEDDPTGLMLRPPGWPVFAANKPTPCPPLAPQVEEAAASVFMGMKVVLDPTMPPDEIRFEQGGKLVGRIVNAAPPHDSLEEAQMAAGWPQEAQPATVPAPAPLADTPLRRQEGGAHYKSMKIQPVEYIHANGIGYFEGNVVKYVSRWRAKGGLQDLKKARHYLDLLIEMEGGAP